MGSGRRFCLPIPRRSPARAVLAGAATAALFACSGLPKRSEELRGRLIGLDGRALRACVGVPASVDVAGDSELLTYRFADELNPLDRLPADFPGSIERARVRDRGGRDLPGFCELTFELREGRVQEVRVRGRRSSGLNDDAGCLRRAESCAVPEGSEPEPQK